MGDRTLKALLAANPEQLEQQGWFVGSEVHAADIDVAGEKQTLNWAAQMGESWAQLVTDVRQRQGAGAILACPHLSGALLVQGQAAAFIRQISTTEELICSVLVRRIDEYVAARYLEQLRTGRVRRLSSGELHATGSLNFFPRLNKWRMAAPEGFRVLLCDEVQPQLDVIAELFRQYGAPPVKTDRVTKQLQAQELNVLQAEVVRRCNRLIKLSGAGEVESDQLRVGAFSRVASWGDGQPIFRIDTDSAHRLLARHREDAEALAVSMSADDAERFLSQDVQSSQTVDETTVDELLRQVANDLELNLQPDKVTSSEVTFKDVRQVVRKARNALEAERPKKYQRLLSQLTEVLPQLSEYRERGVAENSPRRIPARVVQYWDPSPPPTEILPWLDSWKTIGVSGGEHEVADYERGLAVVEEAIGAVGVQAYAAAPHAAVRSDLYRYAELHLRGGWYVDAEHEALLPVADLMPWSVDHIFVIRTGTERIPNGFIGAVAGSPLMIAALEQGCRNVLDGETISVMQMTGPWMFTKLVLEYVETEGASYVVLPTNVVFNGVFQRVHNQAEYKVHSHWRHVDLTDQEPTAGAP